MTQWQIVLLCVVAITAVLLSTHKQPRLADRLTFGILWWITLSAGGCLTMLLLGLWQTKYAAGRNAVGALALMISIVISGLMTNARMESFIIRRQRSSTTTEQTNISGRAIDSVADLYFGISGFFIMLIPLLKSLIEFVLAAAWTAGVFYLIFTAIKAL